VVLVAIILSVSLFLSQLPPSPDNPNGSTSKKLEIIDAAKDGGTGTLIVYVENTGSKSVDLTSECDYSVNDIEIPLFVNSVDKNILEEGEIATIQIPFKISSDISFIVKIIANGTTLAEMEVNNPNVLPVAYTLNLNIQGDSSNKVTKIPDQSSYSDGTTVTLTAEPIADWSFSDWSGDAVSSTNPLILVIDGDKTINAKFIEGSLPTPTPTPTPDIETVDVTFTQTGLDSSATGIVLTVESTSKSYDDFPFTLSVNKNSLLNYDFSDMVTSNSSGKRFVLGSVTGPDSPISTTSDLTIRANFETQFEVTFSTDPVDANATTQPADTQLYNAGQEVTINTDALDPRFVFSQWETSNQDNQIENINSQNTSITINGPGSITAIYRLIQLPVSFEQNGINNPAFKTEVTYKINDGDSIVSTVPFNVLVDHDSSIEYTYQQVIAGGDGVRYMRTSISHSSPLTITEDVTIVGTYDLQYFFFFYQTGLDDSAVGTVLTINGEQKRFSDLDNLFGWFNSGTTYSYTNNVSGGPNKRFLLESPIGGQTIRGPGSITGFYEVQYFFAVTSPIGSPTGEGWYDEGTTVSSSVVSPVVVNGPPEIVYTATGYDGSGSAPDGDTTTMEFTIDSPSSVTWLWSGIMKLYPDAIVDQNIPESFGSDDHVDCVTDQGSPDSKYIYSNVSGSAWRINYYSLQNSGSISGSIERVTVYTECKRVGDGSTAADARIYMRLGGEDPRSSQFRLTEEWVDYSYSRTTRPGGGSWSWNYINNLQCGIELQLNTDDEAACTHVWVEVEFTV